MTSPLQSFDLYIEPSPRQVRVRVGEAFVATTRSALLVHERERLPVYYFPLESVESSWLEPSTHKSECARKGVASYWHLVVGDRRVENAVWRYSEPTTDAGRALEHYYAFEWKAVDAWYEEEEQLFLHPHARDPYKRVDAINSSRHVRVLIGDQVVADSRNTVAVFETGLPTRYYFPLQDVAAKWLRPSTTLTSCPYKGQAHYWSVQAGDTLHKDVVWYYPTPIPEIPKIAGLLAFYQERVTRFEVDGVAVSDEPWHRSVLDFFNHGTFYSLR